jgi:hypothetical protein
MRGTKYLLLFSAMSAALWFSASDVAAQTDTNNAPQRRGGRGRQGNFDPAQFQQRMLDRYRERLEITDDGEWKAIEPLIQNVMEARMSAGTGMRSTFGRGGRRGGGDAANTSTTPARPAPRGNSAADELQKAIDAKVPSAEMKTALAKYMDFRKAKRADLEKAQDALRAVLTSRQEAIAALSGLL